MTNAQERYVKEIISKQRMLYKAILDCTHYNETQDISMIGDWIDQLQLDKRNDITDGIDVEYIVEEFFELRPSEHNNRNYLAQFLGSTIYQYIITTRGHI